MSVFLSAIDRINEIDIDDELKAPFEKAMKYMHIYYTDNDLLNVFDMETYFEQYFFNKKYKNISKIYINLADEKDIYGNLGLFDTQLNILQVAQINLAEEPALSIYYETEEDFYVSVLLHELDHAIKLQGSINIEQEGKTYKVTSQNLINQPYLFEPLTELLREQILPELNPKAYYVGAELLKYLNTALDIDFNKAYLKRDLNSLYKKQLSTDLFLTTMKNLKYVYQLNDAPTIIVEDTTFGTLLKPYIEELLQEVTNEYTANLHIKRSELDIATFLSKHINLSNLLPFKNNLEFTDMLKTPAEIYSQDQLEINNIKVTEQRVQELSNIINSACDDFNKFSFATALDMEYLNIEKIRTSDNINAFILISNNSLKIIDINDTEFIKPNIFEIIIAKDITNFKQQSIKDNIILSKDDMDVQLNIIKPMNGPLHLKALGYSPITIDIKDKKVIIKSDIETKQFQINNKKTQSIKQVNYEDKFNKTLDTYKAQDHHNDNRLEKTL